MQNEQAHVDFLPFHTFLLQSGSHAGMWAMFAFTLSHYADAAKKCQEDMCWTTQELHKKREHYNLLNMLMKESAWTASGDVALFMACSTAAAVQEWMTGTMLEAVSNSYTAHEVQILTHIPCNGLSLIPAHTSTQHYHGSTDKFQLWYENRYGKILHFKQTCTMLHVHLKILYGYMTNAGDATSVLSDSSPSAQSLVNCRELK